VQFATVLTRVQQGLEAHQVRVEVHLSGGLPSLSISGMVETSVKESRDRVCAAIRSAGLEVPDGRIVISLAPANLPKAGSRFDLPIALGILAASGQVPPEALSGKEFFGELGLSGDLRSVPAILPAAMQAGVSGHGVVAPDACAEELALLDSETIALATHLTGVVGFLWGRSDLPAPLKQSAPSLPGDSVVGSDIDFSDVCGQVMAKRGLLIAAAGGHNLLMSGSPGAGKSMLAQRFAGLLAPLSNAESLQTAALYSLAGQRMPAWQRRPFRSPHHTSSSPALVGGSSKPVPGEISLAHNGVLFLDELPEFPRAALEALREPLETGSITIARAGQSCEFPASFQLLAAMNPCPCGYAGDAEKNCRCTPEQVRRYQQKISGPLLDRIDICLQISRPRVSLSDSRNSTAETTESLYEKAAAARDRQIQRAGKLNAMLGSRETREYCWPDATGLKLLEKAAERFGMSYRACDRVLRVARTIADLDAASCSSTNTNAPAITGALALRGLDQKN